MRYRAFVSHARSDVRVAKWLQHELNAYRTPRSLVGVRGAQGPIPARFKLMRAPSAHGDDEQARQDDLRESQALIVLCSAAAAQDAGVNRDIDVFGALGR